MPKIIMTVGLPASGKSSWAKEEQLSNKKLRRISKDDIRRSFFNGKYIKEGDVLKVRDDLIKLFIGLGNDVVVDDTNLNPVHKIRLESLAKELGAELEINDSFLEVAPEECVKRDLHRGEKAVGSSVIWDMWYKWLAPRNIDNRFKSDLPRVVLCDIDGTLAHNVGGRSFFDMTRVDEDTVDPFIACIIDALYNYGIERDGSPYPKIIIVSGRNECAREKTEKWLQNNMIPYDELLMRADGDTRPDEIVKEEIYHNSIEPKYTVLGVFDDRPKVARMWKRMGLTVCQLGRPEVEF